jgi:hypothetical protein
MSIQQGTKHTPLEYVGCRAHFLVPARICKDIAFEKSRGDGGTRGGSSGEENQHERGYIRLMTRSRVDHVHFFKVRSREARPNRVVLNCGFIPAWVLFQLFTNISTLQLAMSTIFLNVSKRVG